MWVKRTAMEVVAGKLKKNKHAKYGAFGFFIFLLAMITIMQKIGFGKASTALNPMSWSQILERLPFTTFGIFSMSVIFYFSQKRNNAHTMICTSCFKEKKMATNFRRDTLRGDRCACGGNFDYLEKYKHINDFSKSSDQPPEMD